MRNNIAIIKYFTLCFLLLTGVHALAHESAKDKIGFEKDRSNKPSPTKTPGIVTAPAPIWTPEMLSNVVIPGSPLAAEDILVIDSAKSVFEQITRNGSWVNLLTDNSSVKFPFGMLKKMPNYSTVYQLAFSSVSITKTGAIARVFGRMLLNGSQSSVIYFQGFVNLSRIGGAGNGNKLTLIGDQTVNNSADWSFVLNGSESSSPTTMSFDCNGFTGLDIIGSIILNKDKYKPVSKGSTSNSDEIKSSISLTGITKWEEIYKEKLQFNGYFTTASFPLLGGYSFRISEATLDMNDNKSPSGGDLGTYISKDNAKPGLWRGLAIVKMDVSLPEYFYTGKKTSRVVGVKYGVIDDNGFSFSINANNVFDFSNGSANGWDMSVTKLSLSVLKGEFNGGSFSGKLVLPIEDPNFNGRGIPYETTINDDGSIETTQGDGDLSYITMKPWYGYIHPENITLLMDIDLERNVLLPKVTISGSFDFSMSGENSPYIPTKAQDERDEKANFGIQDLAVEDMMLQTEGAYITIGSLGASNELTLGGFSAAVAVEFRNEGPEDASDAGSVKYASLHFDANMQFGGGKVSGGTTFDLYMKYDSTKKKWQYVDYHISKVKVGYEGGQVKFSGEINYMKDKVYGLAYGGTIKLTVLGKIEMGASVLFGHKVAPNGKIYDFYNVDAMVKSVRYQINPYLTITGFSGGITYRMDPVTPDGVMPVSLSGISYKPNDQSFLRVRAGVYFEVVKERLMTGWGGLEIAFNRNFGVSEVSISGRAQIFSKPEGVIKKPDVNPIKNGDDKSVSSKKSGSDKGNKDEKEEEEEEGGGSPLGDKLAEYAGGNDDAGEAEKGTITGAGEGTTSNTTSKIESLFPPDKYDLPAKFDSATMAKTKSRYVINKPIYDRAVIVFDSMANIGITVSNTYYKLEEKSKRWDFRFDTHPYVQFWKSHQAFSKLVDNTNAWKEICRRIKLPYMITPRQKDNSFIYEDKYVIPTPATIEREARAAPREITSLLLFKAENSNEYGVITVAKLLVPYYNDVFDYNMKKEDSVKRYEALERYWIKEVGMRPYARASGELMRELGFTKDNADLRNAYWGLLALAGRNYAQLRGTKTYYDTAAVVGGTTVRDSLFTYEGMVAVNTIVYDLAVKARSARIKQDGGLSLSTAEKSAIQASDEANEKYASLLKMANRFQAVKKQQSLYDDVVETARLKRQINATSNATTKTNLKNELEILNTRIAQEGKSLSKEELLFNPSKEQMSYLEKNYAKNKNDDTLGGLQILRKPVEMSAQVAIDMVIYNDLKRGTKEDEKAAFREMEIRKTHVGVAVSLLEIVDNKLRGAAKATEAAKNTTTTTTSSNKLGGAVLATYVKPDGDPIVWGDFVAKMDIANSTFSFVLQAYVSVEEGGQTILEGSGANARAGVAELYVSGSSFKINVGTRQEPCGVTVRVPKINFLNAAASFYLEVTNARGNDGSDFSVRTGIGASVSYGFRASAVGVGAFARLGGSLAIDLALKRFENFICNGKAEGGFNGWYGQGSVYVSFSGAAGVIIAGKEIDVLSGSIATTLTITGPSPMHIAGNIRFDYSVLGYRGSKDISMSAGTKCDNIKF